MSHIYKFIYITYSKNRPFVSKSICAINNRASISLLNKEIKQLRMIFYIDPTTNSIHPGAIVYKLNVQ